MKQSLINNKDVYKFGIDAFCNRYNVILKCRSLGKQPQCFDT